MREDETTTEAKKQSSGNEISATPKTTGISTKWKPVLLPLDPNFLRLTLDRSDEYCDEIAVMLQNEEFLAELRFQNFMEKCSSISLHACFRFNQEFLSTLEKEGVTDRSFEDRLKHMGKISRRKACQLAR